MSKFKVGDIITDGELVIKAEVLQALSNGTIYIEILEHEFNDCVGDEVWVDAADFTFVESKVAIEAPIHLESAAKQSNNLTDFSLENIFAMKMF